MEQVRLEVALELGAADTIRGTVRDRDGAATAFTGWLELMSAFDAARERATAGAGTAPAEGEGEERSR